MSCSLAIPIIWGIGDNTLDPFYLQTDLLIQTTWQEYWDSIEQEKEQFQFYLRAPLPAASLLALSVFITRKLLWIPGGREMARHISGPILLEGKAAISHANAMHKSEARK
tara:strand:- start:5065 stop:5394 length:330 start_codon:yes stop_codon:yes gene_type:complete